MAGVTQNRFDQTRIIEDRVARFDVRKKIDKGYVIGSRAGESAHDKVEIGGRKPRPTICPDHSETVYQHWRCQKASIFNARVRRANLLRLVERRSDRDVSNRNWPRQQSRFRAGLAAGLEP